MPIVTPTMGGACWVIAGIATQDRPCLSMPRHRPQSCLDAYPWTRPWAVPVGCKQDLLTQTRLCHLTPRRRQRRCLYAYLSIDNGRCLLGASRIC